VIRDASPNAFLAEQARLLHKRQKPLHPSSILASSGRKRSVAKGSMCGSWAGSDLLMLLSY
jgi:hypothetical protein